MKTVRFVAVLFVMSLISTGLYAKDAELNVLSKQMIGIEPNEMIRQYALKLVDKNYSKWKLDNDNRIDANQIVYYQKALRSKFINAIGGFPEKTDLNAKVVGKIEKDGFTIEKIIFESQPKFYVTANLYLPKAKMGSGPYPALLISPGHIMEGKAYADYQRMGQLLALNGMATMIYDLIEMGERVQTFNKDGQPLTKDVWKLHPMSNVGSILLGKSVTATMIWDGMRCIDYLQSRPEIDPNQIVCSGHSGGGTLAAYLMALDNRIALGAPACYITGFDTLLKTQGPQDSEQQVYGQLAFGMDHADYIMLRAPKPTVVCCATKDFFDIKGTWEQYRYAKRAYTKMGFAENLDIIEADEFHSYNKNFREGIASTMKWLFSNKNVEVREPNNIGVLDAKDLYCTANGQVLKMDGAKSVHDLNREEKNRLDSVRKARWGKYSQRMIKEVKAFTKIRDINSLSGAKVEHGETIKRQGYTIEKLAFEPEKGIWLAALLFVPEKKAEQKPILYLNGEGKNAAAAVGGGIEKMVMNGQVVLAVDIRGFGETQSGNPSWCKSFYGPDGLDFCYNYLLGINFVKVRAEDVLVCAKWLSQEQKADSIRLVSVGRTGVAALHAAALEGQLFDSVKISNSLVSWGNIIDSGVSKGHLANIMLGAIKLYDLDDLAHSLGKKIEVVEPLNAMGEPYNAK